MNYEEQCRRNAEAEARATAERTAAIKRRIEAEAQAQSDAFWDRVTARLDRMPHPTRTGFSKPSQAAQGRTAKQRWNDAVAQARGSGLDPKSAVLKVNKDNPGLREAMLREVNQ